MTSEPFPSKSTLCFLFPFVFWVFIVISVVIRLSLWSIVAPSSEIGKRVRVFDTANSVSKKQMFNSTKYIISTTNFRIETEPIDGNLAAGFSPEEDLAGQTVDAIGVLEYEAPEKKSPNFVLRSAKVSFPGTSQGSVRSAFLLFSPLRKLSSSLHAIFVKRLGYYFSQDELSLFVGMLLGTKEQISASFYQKLQQSGLLHLVAASGYNILMVVSVASILVGLIVPRPTSALIVLFLIILYVFVADGGASVVRAALIGSIGYLCHEYLGSPASAKRVFVLIALLMLWARPQWGWDLGYQLSVAATAGLLWLAPVFERRIRKIPGIRKLPSLSESLSASIAALPVLVLNVGWDRVSWAGVPVNVVASLFVAPVMAVGAGVVLVGSVWPWGGMILALLGRPVIVGLIKTVEFGAWVNGILKG